ncbi:MAG TPA: DUF6580 family putative transport protein [Chthoniobacterales bacterium]
MKKEGLIFTVLLLIFGAFYRVIRLELLPELPNFSPAMAIAFCGALFLPGRMVFAVSLPALFISDLLLNVHYGQSLLHAEMLSSYFCYGAAIALGLLLRGKGPGWIFGATLFNAVLFYLVTNTVSWATSPLYAHDFGGWLQSITVGLPGFPPSLVFFRNSLVSDLLFTALFLGVGYAAKNRSAGPNLCRQEASS